MVQLVIRLICCKLFEEAHIFLKPFMKREQDIHIFNTQDLFMFLVGKKTLKNPSSSAPNLGGEPGYIWKVMWRDHNLYCKTMPGQEAGDKMGL